MAKIAKKQVAESQAISVTPRRVAIAQEAMERPAFERRYRIERATRVGVLALEEWIKEGKQKGRSREDILKLAWSLFDPSPMKSGDQTPQRIEFIEELFRSLHGRFRLTDDPDPINNAKIALRRQDLNDDQIIEILANTPDNSVEDTEINKARKAPEVISPAGVEGSTEGVGPMSKNIQPIFTLEATPEEIGARLRAARESKGLTQTELAQAMGLKTYRTVQELEKGGRDNGGVSLTSVRSAMEALQITEI
jgi:DNA-binding XRE family transcriptional regulator